MYKILLQTIRRKCAFGGVAASAVAIVHSRDGRSKQRSSVEAFREIIKCTDRTLQDESLVKRTMNSPFQPSGGKYRVILDVDIASDVDDTVCLFLAMCSENIELVGVTTSGRQTLYRAQVAAEIIRELGGNKEVVHAGESMPLDVAGQRPFNWFYNEVHSAFNTSDIQEQDAVDFIIKTYEQPSDVILLGLGPMTNIGKALRLRPDIAKNIPFILLMGGTARPIQFSRPERGEFHQFLDYNMVADSHATKIIFNSPVPIFCVPATCTLQAKFYEKDVEKLLHLKHPIWRKLAHDIFLWQRIQRELWFNIVGDGYLEENVACINHDPLVLASLLDPSIIQYETSWVEPVVYQDDILGKSVFRTIEHKERTINCRPVQIATSVDNAKLRRLILDSFRAFDSSQTLETSSFA